MKSCRMQVAIVGAGPAGVMAALQLTDKSVVVLDKQPPLLTLLPTGGGRCNLSHAEFDPHLLVKNYPRGEKFLLSVFQRFGVAQTLEYFHTLGLETYVQPDQRIFPKSNRATEVREVLLQELQRHNNVQVTLAEVLGVQWKGDRFRITTSDTIYDTKYLVIATGGNRSHPKHSGYQWVRDLGHTITPLRPALCGLRLREKQFATLSGVGLEQVTLTAYPPAQKSQTYVGPLLFTHQGISGPVVLQISSKLAYVDYTLTQPLALSINWSNISPEVVEQTLLEDRQWHVGRFVRKWLPQSLAKLCLEELHLSSDDVNGNLTKLQRRGLVTWLTNYPLSVVDRASAQGEMVTAGGVDLGEIRQQDMQSRLMPGLAFAGEVLDIDGLTGGFNLQMCWSTGYLAGQGLNSMAK